MRAVALDYEEHFEEDDRRNKQVYELACGPDVRLNRIVRSKEELE